MKCSKSSTCVGYGINCEACTMMSDIYNHYPKYVNVDEEINKVMGLLNDRSDLVCNIQTIGDIHRLAQYLVMNGVRVDA